MRLDKYVGLDDFEHGAASYDTYYAAHGYMLLSGYNDETGKSFLLAADATYRFDNDSGQREHKQIQSAIKDGTLSAQALAEHGFDVVHFDVPHKDVSATKLAQDVTQHLHTGCSLRHAINVGLLEQYGADDPQSEALRYKTEDLLTRLKTDQPDGPKQAETPKRANPDGKFRASVTIRKR